MGRQLSRPVVSCLSGENTQAKSPQLCSEAERHGAGGHRIRGKGAERRLGFLGPRVPFKSAPKVTPPSAILSLGPHGQLWGDIGDPFPGQELAKLLFH